MRVLFKRSKLQSFKLQASGFQILRPIVVDFGALNERTARGLADGNFEFGAVVRVGSTTKSCVEDGPGRRMSLRASRENLH